MKNPCDADQGIRYYRPKPYLLITPHKDKDSKISDEHVDIEMKMMPDFAEEYSIHIRSGLGDNATEISLDDGWNLTSINVEVDSKFSDNVSAVTDGLSEFVKTNGGSSSSPTVERQTVRSHNVPMGFYEAVISTSSSGKKRMYGWRYLGFSPYAPCPIESDGVACTSCDQQELYGLVFEEGAMVFKALHSLTNVDTRPIAKEKTNIEKIKAQFKNGISYLVPPVLSSVLSIEDVSPQSVAVTEDMENDKVGIQVALDSDQMKAYVKSGKTVIDVADHISAAINETYGHPLDVEFKAVKRR